MSVRLLTSPHCLHQHALSVFKKKSLLQALSQRVHGNAALSVTESGKFSLVDNILQEDYTPASKPLPPKVPTFALSFSCPTSACHDKRGPWTKGEP